MPERIIAMLTGDMPEPILVIPSETWDTFELKGEWNEYILVHIVAAWSKDRQRLFKIEEDVKCKTIKYTTVIGGRGTGIIIPKKIIQDHGIRMSHYLEVILKEVHKGIEVIEIFPKREVFEHFPPGFESVVKKEK